MVPEKGNEFSKTANRADCCFYNTFKILKTTL